MVTLTSILLETKKEESRKNVKHVDTHGGFPKIPKNKKTMRIGALNANITRRGDMVRIVIIVEWRLVATDVRDRKGIMIMTMMTIKIRSK